MYKELNPSKELASYIQSYWLNTKVKENHTKLVESDGCFDVVIYFSKERNDVFLTGIWDKPVMVSLYKNVDILGVRFYLKSLQTFFNLTIAEIKNTKIKAHKQMFKNNIDIELLFNSKDKEEIISFFDITFLSMLDNNNTFINQFVEKLDNKVNVNEIANKLGISRRHLSRELNNNIGITTKTYMSIIRFIRAKNMLLDGKSFADIVFECGYFDQSHFLKEFKKYTGKNPSDYI